MSCKIAVDWGTTNFRAYLINQNDEIIDKVNDSNGLLSVIDRKFAELLMAEIKGWEKFTNLAHTPIYMAGMVGSKQGWHEVDYLSSPMNLTDLKEKLFHFSLPWGGDAFIVPGISGNNAYHLPDVMRGEETQLFGLRKLVPDENLSVILPGTHSKHVSLQGNCMTSMNTIMTGELFSLLNKYSILTRDIPEVYDDTDGFLLGVENGYQIPLSAVLFSARSLMLKQNLSPNSVRSYLSGLLIGSEIAVFKSQQRLYLIGSRSNSQRYYDALTHLGRQASIIDGEICFLNGIKQFYK